MTAVRTWWRSAAAWPLAMLIASAVSVLVRSQIPVTVGRSGADSLLFVRLSRHLAEGQWLGSFDQLTLAKGPAYPALIALTHGAHIPLKIGEQLTWLLASLAVAACIWVVTKRRPLAGTAYVVLALNPDNFNSLSTDVLRDGWYSSLCVLATALLFLAVWLAMDRVNLGWVIATSFVAGLSLATLWLCREEGFTILPILLSILLGIPAIRWRRRRKQLPAPAHEDDAAPVPEPVASGNSSGRGLLLRVTTMLVLLGLGAALPIEYVAQRNRSEYGAALTNDMASGALNRAYADWMRVKAGPMRDNVPITRAQREAVYAVSPAAHELASALDERPNGWLRQSCPASPTCDYTGAYMVWALRSAAGLTGHFGSEADVQKFFAQISADIQHGCTDGRLSCRPRWPASLQTLQRLHAAPFFASLRRSLYSVDLSSNFSSLMRGLIEPPAGDRAETAAAVSGVSSSEHTALRQFHRLKTWSLPLEILLFLFRCLVPLVTVVGFGWLLFSLLTRRVRRPGLVLLSGVLAVGVLVRLVLLAVVFATQWQTTSVRYELPARAFLVAFAVVVGALVVDDWTQPRAVASALESGEPRPEQGDALPTPMPVA